MIEWLFVNPLLRTFAILALCMFSIWTTNFGFNQYLQGRSLLSFGASIAVQILLVSSCVLFSSGSIKKSKRLLVLLLYLMTALISVSGSFIEFDHWICREDRKGRNSEKIFELVLDYKNLAASAINHRITILSKEIAKLERFTKDEAEMGIASHRGAGQGPMYRTFMASTKSLESLKDHFDTLSNNIETCISSNAATNFRRSNALDTMTCVSSLIAKAPSDDAVKDELNTVYKLIDKMKYGSVFNKSSIKQQFPKEPVFNIERSGSKEELFVGAFKDLKEMRLTSILALIGAIIVDLLIFLLAIIDSLFKEKDNHADKNKVSTSASGNLPKNVESLDKILKLKKA